MVGKWSIISKCRLISNRRWKFEGGTAMVAKSRENRKTQETIKWVKCKFCNQSKIVVIREQIIEWVTEISTTNDCEHSAYTKQTESTQYPCTNTAHIAINGCFVYYGKQQQLKLKLSNLQSLAIGAQASTVAQLPNEGLVQ